MVCHGPLALSQGLEGPDDPLGKLGLGHLGFILLEVAGDEPMAVP